MTVRDLYRVLTLSTCNIELEFYDENLISLLYNNVSEIQNDDILYIKNWVTFEEQRTPIEGVSRSLLYKSVLRLYIVIRHSEKEN